MKYTEELLWILDKPGSTLQNQEEAFQENIAFVHSLGLKCDCVGWCRLDLSDPRTREILHSISGFCKEKGWHARGIYTRQYVDVQSDWYELAPSDFGDNTLWDRIETVTGDNRKIYIRVIRAFHELTPAPKMWGDEIFVPERFRNFCLENNLDGLDFCWAKDKGKYEAEQYFHIYGKHLIPRMAVDFALKKSDAAGIKAAGGWLPEIAEIFHELQQINLQDCYLQEDMPHREIAYAYIPSTFSCAGRHAVLIHKDTAQAMMRSKILPASALRPAPVVEALPGGYALGATRPVDRPKESFGEEMLLEYRKLKGTPRPLRMVTEKEALKILRLTKKERKEDFRSPLPKAKSQELHDTDYRMLVPYYRVSNGGYISDEYEWLSFAQAQEENEKFQIALEAEELLDAKPKGIVIGKCPDGDHILLCEHGEVIRFSHEAPEITGQWPSLAQFFVDAINE